MSKVKFEITGDMVDGYMELILGILFMGGLIRKRMLTKRKNEDGSYTLIVRIEGKNPPLGSLGLGDIPDEE